MQRKTVADIRASKGKAKIVALTAYTTPVAQQVNEAADLVLVGDSVGMVLYGMPSTVGVSLDMMIMHGKAVGRGLTRALMVIDMPFGSYEASFEKAFENAAQLLADTGAQAVKLEGGAIMAPTVAYLAARGVPVMGHIGLTPQSVHALGGYKVQGRGAAAESVIADARAIEAAGAFAIVLEKVPASLASSITDALKIPTIGIGAGAGCDGQILVTEDVLGVFEQFKPKFVRRYAEVADISRKAIADYAAEVRDGTFPGPDESFRD